MNEPWTLPPPDSPGMAPAPPMTFGRPDLIFRAQRVITYTDIARIALVAKGRFLTIAGTSAFTVWQRHGDQGSAHRIAGSHASVGIVTLKNRTLTPVAQLFIDCAREVAKPLAAGKSVSARRRQVQDA